MWLHAVLVFACGAAYEACCVAFVHFAEREAAARTALFSVLAASAELSGILDSAQAHRLAPFFIVGYGTGTFAAVKVKRWLRLRSPADLTVPAAER